MRQISELDNLPLKDLDPGREGIERSPIASFFTSPINFPTSKYAYGSPQMQGGMLSFSGMNSSRFNPPMGSPLSLGTPLDFSSLVNAQSFHSAFPCDNFSPCFFGGNGVQAPESFYKAEDKDM
eukprot:TRINITY_DN11168_c0_g1_i9.p3 TRINITY_DN11168_c0_g1~~TRINITY_DN11168_c0_g1_i9.p3  ORF type:complete len:123 (-),score=18.93 TRINITY_DN11168_c0_g1_i9:18-386(-)